MESKGKGNSLSGGLSLYDLSGTTGCHSSRISIHCYMSLFGKFASGKNQTKSMLFESFNVQAGAVWPRGKVVIASWALSVEVREDNLHTPKYYSHE